MNFLPDVYVHCDKCNGKRYNRETLEVRYKGNTVIVIEHNMDVIKVADHIIDIGPEGGKNGGGILCTGIPEEIVRSRESFTAGFLKEEINNIQ